MDGVEHGREARVEALDVDEQAERRGDRGVHGGRVGTVEQTVAVEGSQCVAR